MFHAEKPHVGGFEGGFGAEVSQKATNFKVSFVKQLLRWPLQHKRKTNNEFNEDDCNKLAIGYRLSAGVFLCVICTSVHAVENWRIDNCQIIKDVPRKSGNTTSGYYGTNDSLEFHENLTVSISDIELSKGMTCKDQEKCISIKRTLYRPGERDVIASCTNQTPSISINGSSEGVMPKQILEKAKSTQKLCLNLARGDASRATAGRVEEMQRQQASANV